MPPLQIQASTPAHIRAFVEQAPCPFPLDWDLDRVAERGYARIRTSTRDKDSEWHQYRLAVVRWALTQLATSKWLDEVDWVCLEPPSPRGLRDALEWRLFDVLEVVAAGGSSARRKKTPAPSVTIRKARAAFATLRQLRIPVSFADVAEHCPHHRKLSGAIDAANNKASWKAQRAMMELKAAGEEPLLAFARSLATVEFTKTPTLDEYLSTLEVKLDEVERRLIAGDKPPWLESDYRARNLGKHPNRGTALQRAIVLGLGWNFHDGCKRPRRAKWKVVEALCRTWFRTPLTASHIDDLLASVNHEVQRMEEFWAKPAPKPRKSRRAKG